MLQRAMVFTLTAAMLVGTPLTASAAPLNEVYQITDPWGNRTDDPNPADPYDTRTGTVSGTESNSSVLDTDNLIAGITLSETNVVTEYKRDIKDEECPELEVTIDWEVGKEGEANKVIEKGKNQGKTYAEVLKKSFRWSVEDKRVVAVKGRAQNPDDGNDKVWLVPKAGGTTTVTVSLDSNDFNIHYTATATVTVEQYATKLSFSDELAEDAYEGAVLKLDDYLVKDPVEATDNVTYVIKSQGSNTKATLKKGVLTLKLKKKWADNNKNESKVTIVAIGKKVAGEKEFSIKKANPAKSIKITPPNPAVDGFSVAGKKADWLINTAGKTVGLGVEVTAENEGTCTDKVTWTSQKPAVVALTYNNPKDGTKGVTLTAKSVGTSKITAKAGKKSYVLTVTVRANLTGVDITTGEGELYSGQTIQLTADQFFGKKTGEENGKTSYTKDNKNFTDAGLNWVFDGGSDEVRKMKKLATLNAKTGVLTIQPTVGENQTIKVKVQNAKKVGKKDTEPGSEKAKKGDYGESAKKEFKLTQINVTSISVYSNLQSNPSETNRIASAILKDGKPLDQKSIKIERGGVKEKNTVNIANGTSRTYKVVVKARYVGGEKSGQEVPADIAANVVGWSSKKPNFATVSASGNRATVNAIKKGKSTITVSSATLKKGKTDQYVAIRATFNANVTAPTKSIALSVKNPGIAYKESRGVAAKQTVKITAKLDKGTTNKTKEIEWSASGKAQNGTPISVSKENIKGGTLKLEKGMYHIGDTYTVTAKLPRTGVQTNITVKIVEPTGKVQFVQKADGDGSDTFKKNKKELYLEGTVDTKLDLIAKIQKKGDPARAWKIAGEDNYASVTYTLKGESVRLVGNTLYPVKAGKTTVTAKTSDGKTAKLTVDVKAATATAPAAE